MTERNNMNEPSQLDFEINLNLSLLESAKQLQDWDRASTICLDLANCFRIKELDRIREQKEKEGRIV